MEVFGVPHTDFADEVEKRVIGFFQNLLENGVVIGIPGHFCDFEMELHIKVPAADVVVGSVDFQHPGDIFLKKQQVCLLGIFGCEVCRISFNGYAYLHDVHDIDLILGGKGIFWEIQLY